MKGFIKKLVTRVAKGQGGFTLIEMIVVVGIIAVLAAVIIPNIGKFISSGEQGALDAEREAVQTAMNAMMADHALGTITGNSGSDAVQDWVDKPAADPQALAAYLQLASGDTETQYWYCYDDSGIVVDQGTGTETFTCD